MKMMKLCSLLFLSVCFASISYAQAADSQSSVKEKGPSQESDLVEGHDALGVGERLIYNLSSDLFMPDSSGSSCAYMRTYRVKRQVRGSDAVSPAGYTTCVPTRRFEMRSAVETHTNSGIGEK
jgi:hypothetical protein